MRDRNDGSVETYVGEGSGFAVRFGNVGCQCKARVAVTEF